MGSWSLEGVFFEHARMQQGRRQAASVKNCSYVTLCISETDVQLLSWQIQFLTTFLCWHCLLLVPYGHTRYIIWISFVNLIHIFQIHFIYSKLFWYKLCLHFLLCRYTREELRNRVVGPHISHVLEIHCVLLSRLCTNMEDLNLSDAAVGPPRSHASDVPRPSY